MRLKKIITGTAFIILFLAVQKVNSQDDLHSMQSVNSPLPQEMQAGVNYEPRNNSLIELDKSYKEALENGNKILAEEIKSEMYKLIPGENIYAVKNNKAGVRVLRLPVAPETDWTTANERIHFGTVNHGEGLFKQIDMKMGEDKYLYSVVTRFEGTYSSLIIYKSSNNGNSWSSILGLGVGDKISNISMIVESKNNLVPDSTRVIVFYTDGELSSGNNATINYLSVRRTGEYQYGQIAAPDAGNRFTGISAVTDGAYWSAATYFGVVCTESDNVTGVTKKLRFFRTIDWGKTWAGSTINTSQNDKFPSAGYKEGTDDSVYIAVERSFDSLESQIRVITTPWIPSSNFKAYYLTSALNVRYEKPCLTVRQNNPASGVLITCTKNNIPIYHYTYNGGASWNIDYSLNTGNSSKKLYTYCSSSINGPAPYTACVLNMNKDSINIRKGVLGSLGNTIYKVNSFQSQANVTPVCESIYRDGKNYSIVTYAGTQSPYGNTFSAQEGYRKFIIKVIPQGYYNPATNALNGNDSISIYIRNISSPYQIVDSGKSILYYTNQTSYPEISNLNDGSYYVCIKHRNSIEIWSKTPVDFTIPGDKTFDFKVNSDGVYGNNEALVDNTPVQYAMYSGDVNQDGIIDAVDVTTVDNDAFNFAAGYVQTDITGNNVTDANDLAIVDNNAFNFVGKITPP